VPEPVRARHEPVAGRRIDVSENQQMKQKIVLAKSFKSRGLSKICGR
jgi:hypothetical protein